MAFYTDATKSIFSQGQSLHTIDFYTKEGYFIGARMKEAKEMEVVTITKEGTFFI